MLLQRIAKADKKVIAQLQAEREKQLMLYRGEIGQAGQDGKDGQPGKDGRPGRDGQDGLDGRGIEKVSIIKDELWVYYDDGTKQNAGRVVSKQLPLPQPAFIGSSEIVRVTTSTTETIQAEDNNYIRQTTSGITTTLTCNKTNARFYIKNASGGDTTISASIDGYSSINLIDNASLTLIYNGDGSFDIV